MAYEFKDDDTIFITATEYTYQLIGSKTNAFSLALEGSDVSSTFDVDPSTGAQRFTMNYNMICTNLSPPAVEYNITENMDLDSVHYIKVQYYHAETDLTDT